MTAVAEAPAAQPAVKSQLGQIEVNQKLFDAIVSAAQNGLDMSGVKAHCVGVSRVPSRQHGEVTGMIGLHGKVSGFVTVNMPQRLALQAVEGLLGESYNELTPQVVDGAGELTNIIVGGVKSKLANSEWSISQITVPSVIVGDGYQVAFASGLELIDVVFEVENDQAIMVSDRLMHITMSLLRL